MYPIIPYWRIRKYNRLLSILALAVITFLVNISDLKADQNDSRLPFLFRILKTSFNVIESRRVEKKIWSIWTNHHNPKITELIQHGTHMMQMGHFEIALKSFDTIVTFDPEFAEGWNKRATLYYLMGEYNASLSDIRMTLILEPNHFGALAGMGSIFRNIGKLQQAIDIFKQCLQIYPFLLGVRRQMQELNAELQAGHL